MKNQNSPWIIICLNTFLYARDKWCRNFECGVMLFTKWVIYTGLTRSELLNRFQYQWRRSHNHKSSPARPKSPDPNTNWTFIGAGNHNPVWSRAPVITFHSSRYRGSGINLITNCLPIKLSEQNPGKINITLFVILIIKNSSMVFNPASIFPWNGLSAHI